MNRKLLLVLSVFAVLGLASAAQGEQEAPGVVAESAADCLCRANLPDPLDPAEPTERATQGGRGGPLGRASTLPQGDHREQRG